MNKLMNLKMVQGNCWLILLVLFFHPWASAQNINTLSLSQCYERAKANYPAIKKLDLISRTAEFDVQNANKRYLPQVSFSGQATYQSQVFSVSDALGVGVASPILPLSKDQYKIQGEIDQLLYDGGKTGNQKELIKANAALQEQNIEVSLYTIKQRINNIFFGILLIDEQLKQNELNRANLQTQVQKAEAALQNGTAFRSSVDELKAEVVTIDMIGTEYKGNRTTYLKMLALFIGQELSPDIQLQKPEAGFAETQINRPELKAFDLQKAIYDVQQKQLRSEYRPQVSAFLQGAYGRPTLNIIKNSFGAWYFTGIRFNWSLGGLYSLNNKKEILHLNRLTVDADRETFLLNTKLDFTQQDEQVKKYAELMKQDEQAVALRQSVAKSAEAQLSNGVITTHEYIQKINAEQLARQSLILHQTQLLQAQYNQKIITGQ